MGSMTHQGPTHVAAYATAAALTMKLAAPLFKTAMTEKAVNDPKDKAYHAWFLMRQVADRFMDSQLLNLPAPMLLDFREALIIAHRNAHPNAADPLALGECPCETAMRCNWILQLLAGAPSRPGEKAVDRAQSLAGVHQTGAQLRATL